MYYIGEKKEDSTNFYYSLSLKDNYIFYTCSKPDYNLQVGEIQSNGRITDYSQCYFYPEFKPRFSNIVGNYIVTASSTGNYFYVYYFNYSTKTFTLKQQKTYGVANHFTGDFRLEQKDANTLTIFCSTIATTYLNMGIVQFEYSINNNTITHISEKRETNNTNTYTKIQLTSNFVLVSTNGKKVYSYPRSGGVLGSKVAEINNNLYIYDFEINTLNSTKYVFLSCKYNSNFSASPYDSFYIYSFNDSDGSFTFVESIYGSFSGISTRVDGNNIIIYTTKLTSGNFSLNSYIFNGTTITLSEELGTTSGYQYLSCNEDYLFAAAVMNGVQTYGLGVSSSSYSSESSASSTSLDSKSSSSLSHSSLSSISSESSNSSSLSSESSDSSLSSISFESKSSTSSISSLSLSSESSSSSISSDSSLSSDSSSSNSSTSSDSSLSSISLSSISQSSLSSDSSWSSESSDSSNSSSSNSSSSNSSQSSSSTTLPITILTELDVFTGEDYFKTYNKNRYVFCCTDTGLDVHKVSNTGEISPLIANNNIYPTGFSITGIGDYIFVPGGGSGLRIFHWDEANEILTYKTGNYQSGNYQQVYVEQFDADNITIFVTSTTAGVLQYNYNTSTNSLTLVDSQDNGDFYMAIVATPNYIVTNNESTLYSYSRANNLIGDSIASSITYGGTYYRELNINYLNDTRYIFAAKDNGLLVYTINESTGVFTQVTVVSGMFKSVTTRQDGNRLIVFVTKDLGDTHEIQCYTFNGTSLTLCDTIPFTNLSYMNPALSMDADFIYAGGSTEGLKIYRWVDNYSESSFSSISSSSTSSDSSFSSNSSQSSESFDSKSSTSSNSSSSDSSFSSSSNLSNSSLSSDSSLSLSSTSISSSSNSSDSSKSSLSSDSSSSISSDSSFSSNSSISSNSLSSDSSSSNSSESSESSLSSTSISSSSLSSNSSLSSLSSVSSLSNSSSSLSSDSSSSNSSHSSFSSDSSTSSLSSISWSSTSASSRSSNSSLSSNSDSSSSSKSSISSLSSDSSSSKSSESSESSISSISLSSLSSSSDSSLSSESSTSSMSSTSSISFSSVSSDSSSSISSDSSFSSNSSISNSSSSNSSISSESSISSVSSTSSLSSESSNSSSSNSSESSISLISKSSSSISSESSQSSSSLSSESSLSSISSSSLSSDSSSSESSESSFSLSSTSSESSTSSVSSTSLDSKSSRSSSSSLSKDSKSSYSSSSLMLEPIDWQITEALIAQLETMSSGYNIKVREVKLLESELRLPEVFPAIIVCPNEIDSDQENISRNDFLPFALVYIDDSNETNLNYRFRNVPADVQRCLRKNQFMDSLAHYTSVQNWENSTFEIDGIEFPCCIIYITIERRMDAEDPYKLL